MSTATNSEPGLSVNQSSATVRPPLARRSVQLLLAFVAGVVFAIQFAISPSQTDHQDSVPNAFVDTSGIRINLNEAKICELALLPNVGPVLAKRIVDDRDSEGPYTSVDDLARVHGIGEKTLSHLNQICFVQASSNE